MAELYNLLNTLGLPVSYRFFKTSSTNPPPIPPYIIYLYSYSSNFGADNKVYNKGDSYQVELYSTKKDIASEKLLEDLFDNNDIFYEKVETYIDLEGLYQVLYEIQL